MKKIALLLLLFACATAFAKPPIVEFFLTKYDGENCLRRAEYALQESGFDLKGGTYQVEDRVGVQGEFKGGVGCSSEIPTAVVFVVSGPEYQKTHALGRMLQSKFLKYPASD